MQSTVLRYSDKEADDLTRAISTDSFATPKARTAKFNSGRRERKPPGGSAASQPTPDLQVTAKGTASIRGFRFRLRMGRGKCFERLRSGKAQRPLFSSRIVYAVTIVASGATGVTNATTARSISLHNEGGSLQVAAPGPAAGCLAAIKASGARAQKRAARPSVFALATMEAAGQ